MLAIGIDHIKLWKNSLSLSNSLTHTHCNLYICRYKSESRMNGNLNDVNNNSHSEACKFVIVHVRRYTRLTHTHMHAHRNAEFRRRTKTRSYIIGFVTYEKSISVFHPKIKFISPFRWLFARRPGLPNGGPPIPKVSIKINLIYNWKGTSTQCMLLQSTTHVNQSEKG